MSSRRPSAPARRARWSATFVLAGCAVLAACGEDSRNPVPAPPRGVGRPPLPALAPVPVAQRAAYALARLLRGPKPLGGLPVPMSIHKRNVELALADLAALGPETLKLLDDPALIERVVGQALRPVVGEAKPETNAWDNVLQVLMAIPKKPTELVRAWTKDALRIPTASADLAPLRLQAAHVLVGVDDDAVAPMLYDLLAADPGNRKIGAVTLPWLLARGEPWRSRTLDVVLRASGPSLWKQVGNRLGGLVPQGQVDRRIADALTWWHLLIEGSGPPPPAGLPRRKSHRWSRARLGLDPDVPRLPRPGGRTQQPSYGPLPAAVTHGWGTYAVQLGKLAVLPPYASLFDGKVQAARTRCRLAQYGFEAYRQAVYADLSAEALDPDDAAALRDDGLYFTALHCMLGEDPVGARQRAIADLRAMLDSPPPPSAEQAIRMHRLVDALPAEEEESWTLLARVLREVRPLEIYRPVIEAAYERMDVRDMEQKAIVFDLLAADARDPASRGVALHLIRLTRDVAYLPAMERELEREADPTRRPLLRRLLLYIAARGYGIDPETYARVVGHVRTWLDEVPAAEAATLVTALLDLGDLGVEAFAQGLRGARRATFLQAWPQDGRVVAKRVAEALLEPLGVRTPRDVLARALMMAYFNSPSTGDAALAALERRVAAPYRPWVAAVLERVRHRAPRHPGP